MELTTPGSELVLGTQDIVFLCDDALGGAMHYTVSAVVDCDAPYVDDAGRVDTDAIRAVLAERVASVPELRKVLRGRLGLLRPSWDVEDGVDITSQVHLVTPLGSDETSEMLRVVQAEFDRRIDLHRPPWRIAVIPFHRRCGVVLTIHHAFADGANAFALVLHLLAPLPDGSAAATPSNPMPRSTVGDRVRVQAHSARAAARDLASVVKADRRALLRLLRRAWQPATPSRGHGVRIALIEADNRHMGMAKRRAATGVEDVVSAAMTVSLGDDRVPAGRRRRVWLPSAVGHDDGGRTDTAGVNKTSARVVSMATTGSIESALGLAERDGRSVSLKAELDAARALYGMAPPLIARLLAKRLSFDKFADLTVTLLPPLPNAIPFFFGQADTVFTHGMLPQRSAAIASILPQRSVLRVGLTVADIAAGGCSFEDGVAHALAEFGIASRAHVPDASPTTHEAMHTTTPKTAEQMGSVLLGRAMAAGRGRTPTIIAIDGPGGAGKSTLARAIAAASPRATVVEMDDFYLPSCDRPNDPHRIGGDFDWERVKRQVLQPLVEGRAGRYQRYDWDVDALAEWHEVPPEGVVVLEGVFANRAELGGFHDFTVWVDCSYETRLRRGLERDGEKARSRWVDDWMPAEELYKRTQRRDTASDIVIDGSGGAINDPTIWFATRDSV